MSRRPSSSSPARLSIEESERDTELRVRRCALQGIEQLLGNSRRGINYATPLRRREQTFLQKIVIFPDEMAIMLRHSRKLGSQIPPARDDRNAVRQQRGGGAAFTQHKKRVGRQSEVDGVQELRY